MKQKREEMKKMKTQNSELFKDALRKGEIETLRKIEKSDLHNHFMISRNFE